MKLSNKEKIGTQRRWQTEADIIIITNTYIHTHTHTHTHSIYLFSTPSHKEKGVKTHQNNKLQSPIKTIKKITPMKTRPNTH